MPLTYDSLLDDERSFVEERCAMFSKLRGLISARLTAAGARQKRAHDQRMDLLDIDLQPGQLVVRKQRRIGKLLPPIEGPYIFEGYGNADETTVLLRVPGKKHL